MKYRFLYITFLFLSLLAVTSCTSCGNDSKKKSGGGTINPKVEELDEVPDKALTLVLNDFTADSVYMADRSGYSKYVFAYQDARMQGNVKGNLERGNLYSIFPDFKTRNILMAINITELCQHKWFYDMGQHRGLSFNDKGGMTSINAERICFREWKLLNGKLYLYYVDMQDSESDRHGYQVEETDIKVLEPTRLVFEFMGRTYNCTKLPDKPLTF